MAGSLERELLAAGKLSVVRFGRDLKIPIATALTDDSTVGQDRLLSALGAFARSEQACVVIDAVTRLLPGVMGNAESGASESFAGGLLEYPHYTRPQVWEGRPIPDVLLSGDHGRIAASGTHAELVAQSPIYQALQHPHAEPVSA